jgi:hypothetical protein
VAFRIAHPRLIRRSVCILLESLPPPIAWRKDLERRGLAPSSIQRKLAAVASLFDHLCEVNAVSHNPVRGVKRPKVDQNEADDSPTFRVAY